jgi:hypothetical protein
MIRLKPSHSFLFPVLFTLLLLSSCDKFDGDQVIPSYISIDTVFVTTDYPDEGTDNHRVVDAWLYVDDQLIGGFELPATVPVLTEGMSKVEIRPGIILNGISSTRAPYPNFEPAVIQDVVLVPDSVITIPPIETVYQQNVEFVWMEDFEDASLALKPASQSDTIVGRTDPAGNPVAFLDENSDYSGMVTIDRDRPYMLLQSDDGNNAGFDLRQGNFIFLEVHFKSETNLIVGMLITEQSQTIKQRPYIGLNATDEWRKVYLNFTPLVNEETGAISFKVYFEAYHSGDQSSSKIYFDNIKLLSRRNL